MKTGRDPGQSRSAGQGEQTRGGNASRLGRRAADLNALGSAADGSRPQPYTGRRHCPDMPAQLINKDLHVGVRQEKYASSPPAPTRTWRPKFLSWKFAKHQDESWKQIVIRKLESLECQCTIISVLCTFWALFGDDMNRAYLPGSYDSAVHTTSFVVFVFFMIEMAFCICFQPNYLGFYFYLVSCTLTINNRHTWIVS